MTADDFVEKWLTRAEELGRLGAQVDGARLCQDVLEDFRRFVTNADGELLNLTQSARESRYSTDHLRRLIKAGTLHNYGKTHAPRIRRADLPRKPSVLRSEASRRAYVEDP